MKCASLFPVPVTRSLAIILGPARAPKNKRPISPLIAAAACVLWLSAGSSARAQSTDLSGATLTLAGSGNTISNSLIIGSGNTALDLSVAVGGSPVYAQSSSLAMGPYAYAFTRSAAIGYNLSAGSDSIATGYADSARVQSAAFGFGSMANSLAFAAGNCATASNSSAAVGSFTTADNASFAAGYGTVAHNQSVATGAFTAALGSLSTSAGNVTTAQAYASFVVGQYNRTDASYNATTWVPSDLVFVVGNGLTASTPSNALTVYKNGNVGVQGVITAAPGGDIPMYTGN